MASGCTTARTVAGSAAGWTDRAWDTSERASGCDHNGTAPSTLASRIMDPMSSRPRSAAQPIDTPVVEQVLLFGYNLRGERHDADTSVAELAALAHSAGAEVVDILVQHDVAPNART